MNEPRASLFPGMEKTAEPPYEEPTWLLHHLEVFNWGPFAGMHRAEFDPAGTAIIGPTGSGKTTLVDALMTLLVSQPKYNLASTGGHESDRTLLSYVRGVLGGDGADGRAEVARRGKTVTGMCATYQSGDRQLKMAGLLWADGNSNAAQDLKRRWIFSQADDQSFEKWLTILNDDGSRDLMRLGRETARLRIFDSKKAYLAHARKFFDVGANAFTLLNRAAGLKQLNSIDEIFRDLVLDDRTAFDRALEVASEFDNLSAIHTELETARRQQESLAPIKDDFAKLTKIQRKAKDAQTLKKILPVWFAIACEKAWTKKINSLANEKTSIEKELVIARESHADCSARVETLRQQYLEIGGNVIDQLKVTIETFAQRVGERQRDVSSYLNIVRQFQLDESLTRKALGENQQAAAERQKHLRQSRDKTYDAMLAADSEHRQLKNKTTELGDELQKVKARPGSNISAKFQDFRAELARQVNAAEGDLPFLAELVEVESDQSDWRGAIERAIGSERLRVLVPKKHMKSALRWVNSRDNRLHVRLQEAASGGPARDFLPDGYTQKLNFKQHPLQQTAKRLLAQRDLHCVDSSERLREMEYGLTIEGTMSGRKGRFEKQDQRRLNENWMTGFDNKDQLETLQNQLTETTRLEKEKREQVAALKSQVAEFEMGLNLIGTLADLEFSKIDLPTAQADLQRSESRLSNLLAPDSDASKAKETYDRQSAELKAIAKEVSQHERQIAVLDDRMQTADQSLQKAILRKGEGLDQSATELAEKKIPVVEDWDAGRLDDEERAAKSGIDQQVASLLQRITDQEKRIVRLMEGAKRVDTGALTDVGSDLEDVPEYLTRLKVLTEEALPEKLKRFLQYLNQSSDQGVTQLLAGIDEEVDAIEHRIDDLNRTLLKVDFRAGRYLQLQPQRIKHERLRSLQTAQRRLRSGALKDDEGESHFKALREVIEILREAGESRRLQGARALLDPRYRLEFYVVEVDRQTGDRSPPRTGSQSGSGGEKELMASHILTASLSYALCPTEATRPLYGTVVLDEAFSKSSPSAATRIIEALRIFGLHPIFVTPNKEIGLLKQHTRKVICVQRPGKRASLASISWEKLEGLARGRKEDDAG